MRGHCVNLIGIIKEYVMHVTMDCLNLKDDNLVLLEKI